MSLILLNIHNFVRLSITFLSVRLFSIYFLTINLYVWIFFTSSNGTQAGWEGLPSSRSTLNTWLLTNEMLWAFNLGWHSLSVMLQIIRARYGRVLMHITKFHSFIVSSLIIILHFGRYMTLNISHHRSHRAKFIKMRCMFHVIICMRFLTYPIFLKILTLRIHILLRFDIFGHLVNLRPVQSLLLSINITKVWQWVTLFLHAQLYLVFVGVDLEFHRR